MKLIEKNITMDDLLKSDEAFFTGTAVEITPISKIDSKTINRNGIKRSNN